MYNDAFPQIVPSVKQCGKILLRQGKATVDIIIGSMRIACWIPEAKNTHLEHLTLIDFPLQQ
jgi:hypothetical protein